MRYVLLCFLAVCIAGAPAAARELRTSDVRRIADVEQPAISPDGSRVAAIVVRPDFAQNTYLRELHVIDTSNGDDRILVGDADVALPRWSPDGRRLAYLDRSGGRIAVMQYGTPPRLLARAGGDATDFAWRPDGGAIAFSASDQPSTRDYFEPGDNDYTLSALVPPVHLWLEEGGAVRRLTHGSWTLTPTDSGGIFTPAFTWSHDGRTIVLARLPNTFSGDDERSTLYTLDVASGRLSKLTSHPAVEMAPQFSPDGRHLTYSYPRGGNFLALNTVRIRDGAADVDATRGFDRDIGGTVWMPDGHSLLACGNDETHSRMYHFVMGATPARVDLGDLELTCDAYQSSTFDAGIAATVSKRGAVAFVATTARSLRELYYLPSLGARPRRLTNYNAFFERLTLGRIQSVTWTSSDGYQEFGVVHFPPNAVAGRKYPVVIDIHGGPGLAEIQSAAGKSYGGDWPIEQLIAARGYVVFAPNYRGSDDTGNAFLLAIVGDSVRGPAADILTGLAAVNALPQADTSRVGVSGWSYGGLLTSWLITHDRRWKAAVSGAAVNVEAQEYDLSVSNVQDRYYQNGVSPYVGDGMKQYVDVSPLTYAQDVTTPTLIWGTTGDPVVPVTQSYAFYHALHDNRVPVKFVVFDAPTHGPNAPRTTEELTNLWLDWLDRYLHGTNER
ncbi:MAG TPA: S9 family peptidase [Candidatus Baltobacteraceae bacterium]|jgi:dipeptidyl aminopeptidase/acylaminoacyl peptidase